MVIGVRCCDCYVIGICLEGVEYHTVTDINIKIMLEIESHLVVFQMLIYLSLIMMFRMFVIVSLCMFTVSNALLMSKAAATM